MGLPPPPDCAPGEARYDRVRLARGGGYTGVEVAAEINDFVREATGSYRHVKPLEIKVILLQGRGRILPELTESLATFSHRRLLTFGPACGVFGGSERAKLSPWPSPVLEPLVCPVALRAYIDHSFERVAGEVHWSCVRFSQ